MPIKYPKVKVRMYRQGLGDCFLLTLMASSRQKLHMLIDCGVFMGTRGSKKTMTTIAKDIAKVTKGTIDVVVATHEHYDHLSGFNQARTEFAKMKMSEVWMAWTEDPENDLARSLRNDRHFRIAAAQQAATRLKALNVDEAMPSQFEEIVNFFGPLPAAGKRTIADAIEFLKEKGEEEESSLKYLSPGQNPITFEAVPGIRIYVLGPPIDEELIKRSDPTKRGKEVYEHERHLTLEGSIMNALFMGEDVNEENRQSIDNDYPFSRNYKLIPDRKKLPPLIEKYLGDDDYDWRKIDHDWIKATEEMALKLDSDTNNTSLVLAIEIEKSGEVLLFPGDAQVGNWLSWEEVSWTVKDKNGEDKIVTGHDLLRRTSLYKVGHHGSHNATLSDKGLELMERKDLVALIPVNQKMVDKKKWKMPYGPLLKRLHDKTRGRVIRADHGLAERDSPLNDRPMTVKQWAKFKKKLKETDLYIEFMVD